ncbi:extracellular solute-binding protein [Caldanaerobius polysaccharolyticus]|uniref:extracellular solute-binding protein n=1 Tax=Caldanaerobius polysaccharolyticus TaxID=44256 RepID=UPI001FE027B2|nr:extracellular solute-binding protein [Caldanaerobius polysaccharolyticus]
MVFKKVLTLILCSILLFAFSACSTNSKTVKTNGKNESNNAGKKEISGTVKLFVVGDPIEDTTDPITGDTIPGWKTLIQDFLKTHPKVDVRITTIPWSDWQPKVTTALMNGDVDVVHLNEPKDWYDKGLIEPIDEYVKRDGINPVDLWGNMYDGPFIKYKGIHLGTPKFISAKWTVYDKRLFDDYGVEYLKDHESLDSLMEKAKKMTGKDPKTGRQTYGGYMNNLDIFPKWVMDIFGQTNYAEWTTDNPADIKWHINSDKVIQAYEWIATFARYCPPGTSMSKGTENFYTDKNNVAMWINTNGLGPLASYIKKGEMDKVKPYGVVLSATGVSGKNGITASLHQWSLAKNSKNKDAAWELMKYLGSPEMSLKLYEAKYAIPWGKDVESKIKPNDPYMKTLLKAWDESIPMEPAMLVPALGVELYKIGHNIVSAVENGKKVDEKYIKTELDKYQEKMTQMSRSMK